MVIISEPIIHMQHKGYKDSFGMKMHKVEVKNSGLYTVKKEKEKSKPNFLIYYYPLIIIQIDNNII